MEFKAGDKAIVKEWGKEVNPVNITAVGDEFVLLRSGIGGDEHRIPKHWLLPYQEPKKTVRLAQGIVQYQTRGWSLTDDLYDSLDAVKKHFPTFRNWIWPAKPDADGFYTVDE